MAQVGRSPQDLLDKGVRVDYSKTLDQRAYAGFAGMQGLVNNGSVTATALPATGTGTTLRLGAPTTAVAILGDFNFIATHDLECSRKRSRRDAESLLDSNQPVYPAYSAYGSRWWPQRLCLYPRLHQEKLSWFGLWYCA